MLKLKQDVGIWTRKENRNDYEIINKDEQNIADAWSKEKEAMTNFFPKPEEAEFNSLLITKAPTMAKGLIDLHSQLIDDGFEEDHVLIKGIENVLEGLTE